MAGFALECVADFIGIRNEDTCYTFKPISQPYRRQIEGAQRVSHRRCDLRKHIAVHDVGTRDSPGLDLGLRHRSFAYIGPRNRRVHPKLPDRHRANSRKSKSRQSRIC